VKRGDTLHLNLETFAFEGKSIAKVDGMVVFVRGGVPGDEVRVQLTKVKKQFAEGEIAEVINASPLREKPRCKYFGICGGCKWQQVNYQAQLDFKRQHVVDVLERIGGLSGVKVNPTLGSDETYFYRNKMEFSFGDRWLTREEMENRKPGNGDRKPSDRFALGLHIPERFDKVLDIDECWLQSERSHQIVNEVRSFCRSRALSVYSTFTHSGYLRNLVIRESKRTAEVMVNLVTSEDRPENMKELRDRLLAQFPFITTIVNNITTRKSQVAIGEFEKVYHGNGYIREKLGDRIYRISAGSFFQTNTLQAERLYDAATRMGHFHPTDTVCDLYSGTGTIALHIADHVERVVCIESVEASVKDARANAALNNVVNCEFVHGDVKDLLLAGEGRISGFPPPDVVIVDPPRSGVHPKVIDCVVRFRPRQIVYISCNPSTQARDLKPLCEQGYLLDEVQPVDMFPHTFHIENVVSLSRNE